MGKMKDSTQITPEYATGAPTCPMNYPGFVFRTLLKDGYEAEALLSGTGLTEELLVDPNTRIEFATLRRFLLNAVEQSGDPHLGLRLAQRFDARVIGLPAYAAMSAARFSDAVEILNRFFFLTFSAIEFTFPDLEAQRKSGEAAIRLRPMLPLEEAAYFVSSSALVVCDGLLKAVLGTGRIVSRAETTVSEPEGWADVAPCVDFPIRFAADGNRLFFPEALLSRPLPGADPIHHPRLVSACEAFAAETAKEATLVCQALAYLDNHPTVGVSLAELAAALGHSERGLRRRLEQSGTSFRKLVDQTRERRAREMLAHSTLPIQAIAYDLGFDTPSNFARSFKRWTGVTPKAFREGRRTPKKRGQI